MRQLHKRTKAGKADRYAQMMHKDAEISDLQEKVSRLLAQNRELALENRKLSIRNEELGAAYAGLKAILRNRGVSTP